MLIRIRSVRALLALLACSALYVQCFGWLSFAVWGGALLLLSALLSNVAMLLTAAAVMAFLWVVLRPMMRWLGVDTLL
jgi:hypothetical protein